MSRTLLSLLGAFEVLAAISAASVATIAVGVLGGLALAASPWVPSLRLRAVLLVIGTVPFAILTWWAVAGPLIAVVALAIGIPTLRHRRNDSPGRSLSSHRAAAAS